MFDSAISLKLKNFSIDMENQKIYLKNQNSNAVVVFYSERCGYCHELEPTFNEVHELLKGYVPFYTVNGSTERYLCNLFDIKGFPTILILKPDGSVIEYDENDRTRQNLLRFIRKNM